MTLKTTQVLEITNMPRHKLYYLEQKGYISPARIPMGEMESREYSELDVNKIRLIWKYLQRGFKHKVAYQKAMEELNSSELLAE